jgi:hypothetical protein
MVYGDNKDDNSMDKVAVLTGDIVKSRTIKGEEIEKVISQSLPTPNWH